MTKELIHARHTHLNRLSGGMGEEEGVSGAQQRYPDVAEVGAVCSV